MSDVAKIALAILCTPVALALTLGAIWLFFWGCNLLVWMMSFGFSFTDVLFSSLPSGASFMKVVGFLFDGVWLYWAAFLYIMVLGGDEDNDLSLGGYSLIAGILVIMVIMIYDPRIAPHMPGLLQQGLLYLQNNWNFHLVGAFSWANFDFSGKVSDPFYFTVFDCGLVVSYFLGMLKILADRN